MLTAQPDTARPLRVRIARVKEPTTPPPSNRDKNRFRVLIEPAERPGRRAFMAVTVGGVLDSRPTDCHYLEATYKPSTGSITLRLTTCGRLDCSWCVVEVLTERVAPSWAYWGEQLVDVLDLAAGDAATTRRLRLAGLALRAHGTAGALSIPLDRYGARRRFWPHGAIERPDIEGVVALQGEALDTELVRALREIPVDPFPVREETGGREPSENYRRLPAGMSMADARQIAEDVGIEFDRRRRNQAVARRSSEELWGRFLLSLPNRSAA